MKKLSILLAGCLASLLFAANAFGALDLRNANVHTLDNGLTLLLLEDRTFPIVSVQTVYRVGARDENIGRTGLAHFVEHMAFRGSENFPGTGLVSSVYAAGGEWHGYTYIDQTTYFSTVPADELGLLLRIEADRMSRLAISPDDIEPEIGAVLAEMDGYENDPAAVLHDATVFVSLLAHPYRNNTIGWDSDIRAITYDDVVDFYERYYHPGNAVLAIVGDIDEGTVLEQVKELFGEFEGREANPLPITPEPEQTGERRIRLQSAVERKWFQFAWPAPAASAPDYAAFLLLQELLSGSAGINFRQNDWGTPARAGTPLHGITGDIASWTMPTAQPYVFVVKGSIGPDGDEQKVEDAVAAAARQVADAPADAKQFDTARQRLLDELILDVQTTEDAAHQLAFFSGIDALQPMLRLADAVRALTPADVQRAAARYLAPHKRTVGWTVPGDPPEVPPPAAPPATEEVSRTAATTPSRPAPPAEAFELDNGIAVLLQPSSLSPTVHLQVAMPGAMDSPAGALSIDEPIDGVTSFSETVLRDDLQAVIDRAVEAVMRAQTASADDPPSTNPYVRTQQVMSRLMGAPTVAAEPAPLVISLAGDFRKERALAMLQERFGSMDPAEHQVRVSPHELPETLDEHIAQPRAQARLAYLVPAPAPVERAADAWRALLYILSHDYEGRLGKRAISDRGLVYYIGSAYRSDGRNAWVTLSTGVDPAKLDTMRDLLRSELQRLRDEPPSADEVREALAHRLGRAVSANQSNRELADAMTTDWLWYGELLSPEALEARLANVKTDDVLAVTDAFTSGVTVTISVDQP
ncbi:MAG: insulinase family protein [Woeseia sp.]